MPMSDTDLARELRWASQLHAPNTKPSHWPWLRPTLFFLSR